MEQHTLGFGGGCHWCTEAVFQAVPGVTEVKQGWAASEPPEDDFSEAALVTFNASEVSIEQLLWIHLNTHSAVSSHALRARYRSAVYVTNLKDGERMTAVLRAFASQISGLLQTKVLPLREFKTSPPHYQNYYHSDPTRPFCQRFIAPKLERVEELLKDAASHLGRGTV